MSAGSVAHDVNRTVLSSGQDIFSSGVMSSLVTGFLGAGKALNRNLMKDLGALFEQIAKRK